MEQYCQKNLVNGRAWGLEKIYERTDAYRRGSRKLLHTMVLLYVAENCRRHSNIYNTIGKIYCFVKYIIYCKIIVF